MSPAHHVPARHASETAEAEVGHGSDRRAGRLAGGNQANIGAACRNPPESITDKIEKVREAYGAAPARWCAPPPVLLSNPTAPLAPFFTDAALASPAVRGPLAEGQVTLFGHWSLIMVMGPVDETGARMRAGRTFSVALDGGRRRSALENPPDRRAGLLAALSPGTEVSGAMNRPRFR